MSRMPVWFASQTRVASAKSIFRSAYLRMLGELVDIRSVPATRFKNEFGTIFEQAIRSGAVAITKHDTARAILISVEEFETLALAQPRCPKRAVRGTARAHADARCEKRHCRRIQGFAACAGPRRCESGAQVAQSISALALQAT